MNYALLFEGFAQEDPKTMSHSSIFYEDEECAAEHTLFTVRLVSSLETTDRVDKTYAATVDEAFFTMTAKGMEMYTCFPAISQGVEYSMK